MTQEELEKRVETLMKTFEEVNAFFIAKIAEQIKKIGELNPSSINRLSIMADMNKDIGLINRKLAEATETSTKEMYRIYNKALNDTYKDPGVERALKETPLPKSSRRRLERYAKNISKQTAGTMQNLSNTTAVSSVYRHAVDNAVRAVSSGVDDYNSAMRRTVKELGHGGLQVEYESGYKRRLDTAVRQNIIDGANQIAQQGSIAMGKELGFDAYEISAHARSAPDHEPVQGRVFLIKEFEKMQQAQECKDIEGNVYKAFKRPIGEWNCMHIVMSFSTKHSIKRYTNEQLDEWERANKKGCVINGKTHTLYEVSQLMRKIETKVRREKDTAIAAEITGDMDIRRSCQKRIDALSKQYSEIARISGITPQRERMRVEGFHMVKL